MEKYTHGRKTERVRKKRTSAGTLASLQKAKGSNKSAPNKLKQQQASLLKARATSENKNRLD